MLTLDLGIATLVFTIFVLAIALFGLAASGHFPGEFRSPALGTGAGPAVLWISIAVTGAALIAGTAAAIVRLPWYAMVIGAGAALLMAPLLLSALPDSVVNGRGAMIALSGASLLLGLLLHVF